MSASVPEVIVAANEREAAQRAAERIVGIVARRAEQGQEAFLALCGGTTPGELYRLLASPPLSESIPWDKVQVFFSDERDVPQDHVENNYRMVSRALLDHVPLRLSHVHPMPADCRDMAAAAEQYENTIRRLVPAEGGPIPRFDLVLLGIGGEGHTASLFPDTPALEETERLILAQFVPVIGRNRMTFTFPLINAARCVMFLVTGQDKAQAVATILSNDEQARRGYPASRVAPRDGELLFILDAPAARNVQA